MHRLAVHNVKNEKCAILAHLVARPRNEFVTYCNHVSCDL